MSPSKHAQRSSVRCVEERVGLTGRLSGLDLVEDEVEPACPVALRLRRFGLQLSNGVCLSGERSRNLARHRSGAAALSNIVHAHEGGFPDSWYSSHQACDERGDCGGFPCCIRDAHCGLLLFEAGMLHDGAGLVLRKRSSPSWALLASPGGVPCSTGVPRKRGLIFFRKMRDKVSPAARANFPHAGPVSVQGRLKQSWHGAETARAAGVADTESVTGHGAGAATH